MCRYRKRLGIVLVCGLLCFLICLPCTAESGSGGTEKVWQLSGGLTLRQQGDMLTVFSADETDIGTFSGTLQIACREKQTDVVFLLMKRDGGIYLDACQCADKESFIGQNRIGSPYAQGILRAGSGRLDAAAYVAYPLENAGSVQYRIDVQAGALVCTETDRRSAPVQWNSDAAQQMEIQPSSADSSSAAETSSQEAEDSSSDNASTISDTSSEAESSEEPVSASSADSQESKPAGMLYQCSGPVTVAEMEQDFRNHYGVQLSQGNDIHFFTSSGVSVSTGYLTTGDVVKVCKNGQAVQTITLIIPGDLCGSGHPDEASYQRLRQCVAGGEPLTGLSAWAADMKRPEGEVSAGVSAPAPDTADLLLLKRAADL